MNDNKTVATIVVAMCLAASAVAWAVSYHYTATNKAAISAGLVQDSLPGQTGVYWTKREVEK